MAVANSYAEGWRAWDERYADLVVGKRNWQLAAGGLLVVSIILAAGLVWLSSRSRYVVYAVQVDKLGYALTQAQPLTPAAAPDMIDRIERYEVASFIRQARTVTSDAQVEQQQLNSLLAHTRGAADHFLDEYYHSDNAAHNPFQIAQKETVSVQIDSILQLLLEIDREYLKHGIRELSEKLIERELGPRLEREVLLARERVIELEQWTEIDRALKRRAGLDRVVRYE